MDLQAERLSFEGGGKVVLRAFQYRLRRSLNHCTEPEASAEASEDRADFLVADRGSSKMLSSSITRIPALSLQCCTEPLHALFLV